MRILIRRKAGPLTWGVIALAFALVVVLWVVATRQAPATETAALRARCAHWPFLIGVRSVADAPGFISRSATYVCLPDYFIEPLQFQMTTRGRMQPVVTTTRSWGPYFFIGVLCVFAAFAWYARRRNVGPPPDSSRS
jgi:hypothetical protein